VFVAIHTGGGGRSGVLGECLLGDAKSQALARRIVAAICAKREVPNRAIRVVQLPSLESPRNKSSLEVLIETGDGVADRAFLTDPEKRDAAAKAIAELLRAEFGQALGMLIRVLGAQVAAFLESRRSGVDSAVLD
jgi:N-acetylmuramoyl-L-alanine amidase